MNEERVWKLSDVISHCQQMLAEHGDLPVFLHNPEDGAWAYQIEVSKDFCVILYGEDLD